MIYQKSLTTKDIKNQLKNVNGNIQFKGAVIVKPIGGWKGDGILVADNTDDIKKHIMQKNMKKYERWIIQKYIHNPLLMNGRKFHIRFHLLYGSGIKSDYAGLLEMVL